MKVIGFHLMPYRDLPADFAQRYKSAWVDIPPHLLDLERQAANYDEYLATLQSMEALGFDGIGVNEHHQNAYGTMPSPNLMAAILARQTARAAIVVLGDSLALYNPPTRVAEELAMLDLLSHGRLVAGFVVGTAQDSTLSYGMPPTTLRERYREAHDLIVRAWAAPEPFVFNGKYTRLRYVNPWPRPLQRPHPPIWVPGLGSLETMEWVVEHDYVYCFLSFVPDAASERLLDRFWQYVEQAGKPFNPYRACFAQIVCVGESDAQARRDYAPHVEYFHRTCLHLPDTYFMTPGFASARSVLHYLATWQDSFQKQTGGWDTWVDKGFVIAGSPETVRQRLLDKCQRLRIGNVITLLQVGSMGPELTRQNHELFAREVLPHLRGLWSEHEHHWWPRAATPAPAEQPLTATASA